MLHFGIFTSSVHSTKQLHSGISGQAHSAHSSAGGGKGVWVDWKPVRKQNWKLGNFKRHVRISFGWRERYEDTRKYVSNVDLSQRKCMRVGNQRAAALSIVMCATRGLTVWCGLACRLQPQRERCGLGYVCSDSSKKQTHGWKHSFVQMTDNIERICNTFVSADSSVSCGRAQSGVR